MKIVELLNKENTYAWVQGLRTRILLTDELYEVFEKKSKTDNSYYILKYQGYDEDKAVEVFIELEKL